MDLWILALSASVSLNVAWGGLLWSYSRKWKEAEERGDRYAKAFDEKVKECNRADQTLDRWQAENVYILGLLKKYEDRIYELDAQVWSKVFRSGVEEE